MTIVTVNYDNEILALQIRDVFLEYAGRCVDACGALQTLLERKIAHDNGLSG